MGFRVAVLFGFVLLLSAGSFCSAAQNRPVVGTNQTQEQVAAISQQAAAEQQANRSDQSRPAHSPYTIRLRIHQLKNPAVDTKQDLKQAQENPPGVQPRGFSSQQARQWEEAAPARSLEPILLPGKEPKVGGPCSRFVTFEALASRLVSTFDPPDAGELRAARACAG